MFSPIYPLDRLVGLDDHISDTAILFRGGSVIGMFAVDGVSPDTADAVMIEAWWDQLHKAYRNIHAEDIELRIYRCRGAGELPADDCERPEFARGLAADQRRNLDRIGLYRNRIFLLVQIFPPNAMQSVVRFTTEAPVNTRDAIIARRDRLDEICDILLAQLGSFGLRRLGYVSRGKMIFDEMVEALLLAMTGKWRPVPATTGRVGSSAFSEDISFRSWRAITFVGAGEPYYGAVFTFKNYPTPTFPGMFYDFTKAPYHSTLMQSFRFLSNADGERVVSRKHFKMLTSHDKAADQTEELKRAAGDLLGRKYALGDHSMLLLVFADDRRALNRVAEACWRDLAACGLTGIRMNLLLRAAWLSMLPGGARWRPRPGYVHSGNFTAFEPLHNWPKGRESSVWGPPIATFRTVAGTPYPFHWHIEGGRRPPGNTLITGTTGAGKTTLAGYLIAMTAGRARIAVLDNKRGWENLVRDLGGSYAILGGGQPHCAPLKRLDNTPADIEFLTELYRGILVPKGEEEQRRLALGLSIIMEMPPEKRGNRELRAFFDDDPEGAGARLEPWLWGNELGWVIDAPTDDVDLAGVVGGWDTTLLLDNPRARGPVLSYLSYRISQELDGRPFALFGDEFWRALIDPVFRAIIQKHLRTIRSKDGIVVFLTQSPGEIVESGIARVLIEMCPTQIHGANPRGRRADYVDGLGLTEGQFDALRELQLGQGLYLLVQGKDSLIVQLPLAGLDQLPVLAAQESDLRGELVDLQEAAE